MLPQLSYESYTPEGRIYQHGNRKWSHCRRGMERRKCWSVSSIQSLPKSNTRKATKHAQHIRDGFANHFWGPGQIPWQWKMILKY